MATRAVSARDWPTQLAVLVPIFATAVGAFWAVTVWPPLALVVIAGGLLATAVAGSYTYGMRISLVTAVLTWLVAVLALPFLYALEIHTSVCGKSVDSAWIWLPYTGGALVFFALGSFGLRTHRAWWVVPPAFVLALVTLLLLVAAAPGTTGYCET